MPATMLLDDIQDAHGSDLDIDLKVADLDVTGGKTSPRAAQTEGSCWATAECCSLGGSVSTLSAAAMCLLC
ncbi:hypothetical protein [Streptomyces pseudovenezuelae]|uniref:Lantibiotic n=1 Tax=Streptomyces pseudovenezuelae TaxID=67350 RepID=A0ABT6M267_9ACTN|nr:hypothetical protein [Streptomyces pseudovenezuelae]MDH6222650.1 hypothetical protein [Streptomyces pseudovenezuelae]